MSRTSIPGISYRVAAAIVLLPSLAAALAAADRGTLAEARAMQFPMINPVTKRIEKKNTVFQKVGEDVCAVGAYDAP